VIPVRRINHAVLFVRDVATSVAFYEKAFGFEVVARLGGQAAFLRASGSENHHDLGLFGVGPEARRPERGEVGLYHLAWQVDDLEDLLIAAQHLKKLDAFVGASDHGATKSVYGRDPDGHEFEVMWLVPRDQWGEYANAAPVMPLDIGAELARFGHAP
jgi:catechol-2,3-dioxygenase